MKAGVDHVGVAVAFFCHDGAGNFLMHKRSERCRDEQGTWDIGGGKLEYGETIDEAVMRELAEEYGCVGSIEERLPPNTYLRVDGNERRHWVIIPHIVRVKREDAKLNDPESMTEMAWFKLDFLPEPLHSGVKSDIERYAASLQKYC